MIIPPKFDIGWFAEEDFVEGLSPARSGENWGFIDTKGNWVIAPKYWRVAFFSEGLAAVAHQLTGSKFPLEYIDKSGRPVIQLPDSICDPGPFAEGMASVSLCGQLKVGYISRAGTVVIPFRFARGGPFHEGLAAVVFDGQCYVEGLDGAANSTPPSVPAATSCGGVPSFITKRCGEGFIDKKGKVVSRFEGVRDFAEGLAAVEERGKWGFIDVGGQFRIAPQYDGARSYSEGLAAAKINGAWGYIDRTGEWVIAPQFAAAHDFSDGLALTDKGYVDKSGNRVAVAKEGTDFVQGLAHVTLGIRVFGYIDHSGKVVFRYRAHAERPRMLPYSKP